MAATNITTEAGRARLRPRAAPYFVKIAKRQYLGFRKLEIGGTWTARYAAGKDRSFHAIGSQATHPEYPDALNAALEWFRTVADEDQPDRAYTVAQAVNDYCADLASRKSKDSGNRATLAANKHIVRQIGKVEIARLTTKKLKAWREGLVRKEDNLDRVRKSKDTANRITSMLKAALNLAFRDGVIADDKAWRRLKPFPDVGRARDVFLSREQCAALLAACEPDFRVLVRSALLTGGRYSELCRRKVGDLDAKQGVLHVVDGKTGQRDVVLSDAAIIHFKSLARDKLPGAYLHVRTNGREWRRSDQLRPMAVGITEANRQIKQSAGRIPPGTVFYSLRHTHASLALLAGVNFQVLAENMGTSILMLEKHYGKFLRTDRRAMFNAVAPL